MTEIEQVSDWALTIAAEAASSKLHHYERMADDNRLAQSIEAHARAIERHEAYKREVSDAVEKLLAWPSIRSQGIIVDSVARFIIAKPVDPLVEVVAECDGTLFSKQSDYVEALRAAIEARGGRIVWEGE